MCRLLRIKWQKVLCCLIIAQWVWLAGVWAEIVRQPSHAEDQVEELLQKAENYFQKQQYQESYETYQAVLELEPGNQPAIEGMFEIAVVHKQQTELFQQQHKHDDASAHDQKYRSIVRDLLERLTNQFALVLKKYSDLSEAEKHEHPEETAALLSRLVETLRYLKQIYEKFHQQDKDTQQIIDKFQRAITNYEQERSYYQK